MTAGKHDVLVKYKVGESDGLPKKEGAVMRVAHRACRERVQDLLATHGRHLTNSLGLRRPRDVEAAGPPVRLLGFASARLGQVAVVEGAREVVDVEEVSDQLVDARTPLVPRWKARRLKKPRRVPLAHVAEDGGGLGQFDRVVHVPGRVGQGHPRLRQLMLCRHILRHGTVCARQRRLSVVQFLEWHSKEGMQQLDRLGEAAERHVAQDCRFLRSSRSSQQ